MLDADKELVRGPGLPLKTGPQTCLFQGLKLCVSGERALSCLHVLKWVPSLGGHCTPPLAAACRDKPFLIPRSSQERAIWFSL